MFTGIISDIGTITRAEQTGDLRLEISCGFSPESIKLGDSIACNGVCLTVVAILKNGFAAELSKETVTRTAKDSWQIGKKLNLERPLKMGDTLDGHLVSGHIDGVATIQRIEKSGDSHILTIESPTEFSPFIAPKGSITLGGVSLTVNSVENTLFTVNIIPHTWNNTIFNGLKTGDQLNLEIDIIARYVARLMKQ